jgi:hypothetical protein
MGETKFDESDIEKNDHERVQETIEQIRPSSFKLQALYPVINPLLMVVFVVMTLQRLV